MAAHQAYQANEAHLSRYGDIFSALDAHGLNEEQAKQEIRRMALAEPGGVDQVLLTALDNGGLSSVYSLLQSRHAKALDMLSAATTMENVRGRSGKTVKEQGEFDKSLGDGTGTPRESGGGALGPAPASAAGPAPHADEFSNETDAKLGKDHHLSPLGVQAAHDWVSTGKPAGETANAFENDAKQNYANVYAAAGDITKQMNAIASGNDDADTKIEKLRQINPDVASGVDALLKFQSDPSKPENKIFKTWAHKIDKTWEEGRYKAVNEFLTTNASKILLRADAFPTAGLTVLRALKPHSETQAIPLRIIDQAGSFYVTGDPKYSDLNQAIQGYINEFAGLLSANGVPRVTQLQILREHFKSSMSPAQIRGALQIDAQDGYAIVQGVDQRWKTISGRNTLVPGYTPKADALFKGILDMNAKTGQVDDEAPNELKAVGKKPLPPGQRPSWMTDKQAAPPLTRKKKDELKQWIETHPPDTPGWDEINEQLGINR
jgi:hypothetical protein